MIQSQFIAPELHSAILANIPIAEQDILSRHNLKADWNMLVSTQPDDTWQVDARIHLNIGWKLYNSLSFADQSQCPLAANDPARFIAGVEQQCYLST